MVRKGGYHFRTVQQHESKARSQAGDFARYASSLRPTHPSCLQAPTENGVSFPKKPRSWQSETRVAIF